MDTGLQAVDPQRHLAGQLRDQARMCAIMGSPLYAALLDRAASDVEAGGPAWPLIEGPIAPGRGGAVALRLMAAVHRLVLTGMAPRLARHYPSAGGSEGIEGAWEAFRDVLASKAHVLRPLVALPCQTNEVGRCAGLIWGFFEVAGEAHLPLRVLEVGASAGLNLRFDLFRYGGGGVAWGDPASPVDLTSHWREAPPHVASSLEVVERRGCDRRPLDPASEETRLALAASLWADQVDRLARLRGALELAARVPAIVDAASVEDWLPAQLGASRPGVATVVYHSIVQEYLPEPVRRAFQSALAEAGARASRQNPLGWLRLEPDSAFRSYPVTLTTWPGGIQRVIAFCGAHGTGVRRPSLE